jgi:uncharacterized protein DUF3846
MTGREDLSQYATTPEPFWGEQHRAGVTGYDVMEIAAGNGWCAIGVWGRDGWSLGRWPYVIFFTRRQGERWELAHYIEGDIATYAFPNQTTRDTVIDGQAFWYWKYGDEPWVSEYDRFEQLPPRLRGPYGQDRATTTTLVRVVRVPISGTAEVLYIPPTLDALESIVDGLLQVVPLSPDAHAYCDEEGKLVRKVPNHVATNLWYAAVPEAAGQDILHGDVVILGHVSGEEADCPQWVLDALSPHLREPHTD